MWAAGLNPLDPLTPEQIVWVSPVLRQYNTYMRAKNLGIVFSPKDVTATTLEDLATIHSAIQDVQERKSKRKR